METAEETAQTALRRAAAQLKAAGVENAAQDARLLLQFVLGVSHTDILAGRVPPLNAAQQAQFAVLISRRAAREPLHRILGRREFYGREFALSADTLEPRPDSEALIDLILPFIRQALADKAAAESADSLCGKYTEQAEAAAPKKQSGFLPEKDTLNLSDNLQVGQSFVPPKIAVNKLDFSDRETKQNKELSSAAPLRLAAIEADESLKPQNFENSAPSQKTDNRPLPAAALKLLDMGTGSGILALTLLAEAPQLEAVGADISADALQTAQRNAQALGVSARFSARQSNLFHAFSGEQASLFDFIISNPPYIPQAEIAKLAPEVRLYDPHRALSGGADGLDFYRSLARQAGAHLAADGKIAVEIGAGQEAEVEALFAAAGFRLEAMRKDLGGHIRALLFARA